MEGIRRGNHQQQCVCNVGLDQHLGLGGIARHCRNVALAQLVDQFAVLFGHHEMHALRHQGVGDHASDPSVADQHHLPTQPFLPGCHRQLGQRIGRAFQLARDVGARAQGLLQRADGLEHQRIDGDRQNGAGQDQVLALAREQLERHAHGGQDEGKFADLRQAGRHRQRGIERIAQRQHQQKGRQRLAEHDNAEHGQHPQRGLDQHRRIEQHANRYEEQHRKRVAQRQRFFGGAVGQWRLAQHHAGKEGAQCKRHPEYLGRPVGDAHRGGDHGQCK